MLGLLGCLSALLLAAPSGRISEKRKDGEGSYESERPRRMVLESGIRKTLFAEGMVAN
jgi:hypothetical protein